ncbi:LOW QUALITY PROTEIN: spermatogenesis-associated serine-rich protein 1-like [Apostichopus japonicus]|uniref:LOW QUALITY PROTEIN: spermatogenesis-associated serine-rich protein 1-like n=1 Tax=Stichopus japonicus TaxID=307972 RepID=UPI003AB48C09
MALHVTTDVGKPGRREREKTHFVERRGVYVEGKRGRRFIQHGIGEQPEWSPHARQIDIKHSEKGQLDWVSRVQRIPEKIESGPSEEVSLPRIRCFPGKYQQSEAEWTFYPEGFKHGKKCRFEVQRLKNAISLANNTSSQEISHFMRFGNKRKFSSYWERRGKIPCAALGDKSYQVPEYSQNFHNFGSTRPVVCFGGAQRIKPDTFVPLQPSTFVHSDCYKFRERRRKAQEDVDHVAGLEEWHPAAMLIPPVVWEDGRKIVPTT